MFKHSDSTNTYPAAAVEAARRMIGKMGFAKALVAVSKMRQVTEQPHQEAFFSHLFAATKAAAMRKADAPVPEKKAAQIGTKPEPVAALRIAERQNRIIDRDHPAQVHVEMLR